MDAFEAALRRELAGYEARGMVDRAALVRAELARIGAAIPADAEAAVAAPVEKRTRKRG